VNPVKRNLSAFCTATLVVTTLALTVPTKANVVVQPSAQTSATPTPHPVAAHPGEEDLVLSAVRHNQPSANVSLSQRLFGIEP
jgi:hypothetical protein